MSSNVRLAPQWLQFWTASYIASRGREVLVLNPHVAAVAENDLGLPVCDLRDRRRVTVAVAPLHEHLAADDQTAAPGSRVHAARELHRRLYLGAVHHTGGVRHPGALVGRSRL